MVNNNDLQASLKRAVDDITPDVFEQIAQATIAREEREEKMKNQTTAKKRILSFAVAACLLVACAVGGYGILQNTKIDSVIAFDVNPSVEITTNVQNKVINVKALNAEGVKIIDGMNLRKVDLEVAVNALTGSMVKYGFIDASNDKILVSVQNSNVKKAESIRDYIVTDMNAALKSYNINATVYNQIVFDDDEIEAFAKANNISFGKAVFIYNLCAKDATLDKTALTSLSMTELNAMIVERNITISDIVDYDDDDYFDYSKYAGSGNFIGEERAKEIAYAHAGVTAAEVKSVKVTYDKENGVVVYDLDFYTEKHEFDYEINATTGDIVKSERDADASYASNNTTASYIGESAAKQAAFAHAGISASEVKAVRVTLERDDGRVKYEVDFYAGSHEYEYEIDASTGAVIKYEKDLEIYDANDDDYNVPGTGGTSSPGTGGTPVYSDGSHYSNDPYDSNDPHDSEHPSRDD